MTRSAAIGDDLAIVASVGAKDACFALTSPTSGLLAATRRTYSSSAHSTFTDALVTFAQDSNIGLDHRTLVMCVAGAVHADTVRITNGRWFISSSGLEAMMKRRPTILNDVSAVAWSTLALDRTDLHPLGSFALRPDAGRGRRAVIWFGEGLGAAFIGVDAAGNPHVLDGEAGHMTCPLAASDEQALLAPLAAKLGHMSYERALAHIRSEEGRLEDARSKRERSGEMAAGLLGCFSGSVALAFGAWDGVYVAGPMVSVLAKSQAALAFRNRFEAKGRFRGQLSRIPVWTVDRPDLHLLGAAALVDARRGCDDRA